MVYSHHLQPWLRRRAGDLGALANLKFNGRNDVRKQEIAAQEIEGVGFLWRIFTLRLHLDVLEAGLCGGHNMEIVYRFVLLRYCYFILVLCLGG